MEVFVVDEGGICVDDEAELSHMLSLPLTLIVMFENHWLILFLMMWFSMVILPSWEAKCWRRTDMRIGVCRVATSASTS